MLVSLTYSYGNNKPFHTCHTKPRRPLSSRTHYTIRNDPHHTVRLCVVTQCTGILNWLKCINVLWFTMGGYVLNENNNKIKEKKKNLEYNFDINTHCGNPEIYKRFG